MKVDRKMREHTILLDKRITQIVNFEAFKEKNHYASGQEYMAISFYGILGNCGDWHNYDIYTE